MPFGYRRVFESPREEWVLIREPREGPVVEAIFRGYLRHRSLAKLVSWLEEGGHRTRGGLPWSRAALASEAGITVSRRTVNEVRRKVVAPAV